MPDFDAISTAIAGRFTAAAITAAGGPPAGLANIRSSTADDPQAITAVPCVLVSEPSGGAFTGNNHRQAEFDYIVRFYYARTRDLKREQNACRRWLTILADQLRGAVQLGGIVDSCRVAFWTVGPLTFGGLEYTGLELVVHVVKTEGWAATS